MRNKWVVRTTGLVVLALTLTLAPAVRAGNFHFNGLRFSLSSLVLTGELVGLGNEGANVTLIGHGTVTALCQNKAGHLAPGRNPVAFDAHQANEFTADQNGRALIHVTLEDPTLLGSEPSPSPKQAGCPNGNWQVVAVADGSTNWTAAEVIVEDNEGNVQIVLSFACTTFFEDGVGVGIECMEA